MLPDWYPGEPALQPEKKDLPRQNQNNSDEFLIDIDAQPNLGKLELITPETKVYVKI
jgi:hypothetical protein